MQALRNLKEFPLKNFFCLSGGHKDSFKKTNFTFRQSLEILGNCLKF